MTKQPSITRLAAAIALTLPTSPAVAEHANPIETIEVKGQRHANVLSVYNEPTSDITPDLRSSLTRLPGVQVNANGPVSAIVQYRGLFGDRVNVHVDGGLIAGAGPNAMDSPLSHALSSAMPNLTLYRGIAPVSAGFETIGGAIKVERSNQGFTDDDDWQWGGNLLAQGVDNGDAFNLGAELSLASQQSFMRLNAQRQQGNGFEDGDGRLVPSTFYERDAVRFETGWRQGNHQVNLMVADQNTGPSGTAALAMDINFIDATWYRLNYQYAGNDNNTWQVRLYGNQNEHVMNNFELRTAPMASMFRLNTVASDAVGLTIEHSRILGDYRLDFGAEVFDREHESRITNPNNPMFFINNFQNVERDIRSLYGELSGELVSNWSFTSGVRFTRVESDADPVGTNMAMMNPNAAALQDGFNQAQRDQEHSLLDVAVQLSYAATESLTWQLGVAQKERAPNYQELYSWFPLGVSAGLADGRNYIGVVNLDKESALQLDFGFDYHKGNLQLSPRLFWHDIDDYILGTPASSPAANTIAMMMGVQQPLIWSNTDARLTGVDIYANYSFNQHWSANAVLNYVDGERDDVEDDLYRIAPLSLNLGLTWEKGDLAHRLNARLVARQDDVGQLQNEPETAGFAVVDWRSDWQISESWQLTLALENVLDKTYAEHLAGINRVRNVDIDVGQRLPGMGRTLAITTRYQF